MWKIGIALLFLAMGLCLLKSYSKIKLLEAGLDRYRSTYRYRSGWSSAGWGNYNLFTNDGGKHWYTLEDGAISGPADPKLLERLEGWDAMMEYVEENGPITLGRPGEIEILEKAGFSVEPAN